MLCQRWENGCFICKQKCTLLVTRYSIYCRNNLVVKYCLGLIISKIHRRCLSADRCHCVLNIPKKKKTTKTVKFTFEIHTPSQVWYCLDLRWKFTLTVPKLKTKCVSANELTTRQKIMQHAQSRWAILFACLKFNKQRNRAYHPFIYLSFK